MRWFLTIVLALMPLSVAAQDTASEEDKGMLTRFLESSLSGAGRVVEVDGLRGAISSEATISEIRISDADGLWLSVSGITLNWNRLAVLRGNINVTQLRAEKITLLRPPKTDPSTTSAAATPFALPQLPVSIDIKDLRADRVELGEAILGQAAVLSLHAKLLLLDGTGEAVFKATRLEGPAGKFHVDAAYSNIDKQLRIDLQAHEDAGGIVASLARLPGAPQIGLTVLGDGTLDDFVADIRLTSAGQPRLTGQVALGVAPSADQAQAQTETQTQSQAPTRLVSVDLAGDMAPLFAPEYQEFFGREIVLSSFVQFLGDGRIALKTLNLRSAALNVSGMLNLAANGIPELFDLKIGLQDPDGDAVLLPISGDKIYLNSLQVTAQFDALKGARWTLAGALTGLHSKAIDLDTLALTGQGIINADAPSRLSAALNLDMQGLRLSDPALSTAIGDTANVTTNLVWEQGQDVEISSFELVANGLLARGSAVVGGLDAALSVAGNARLLVPDLARFSGLAGRDLGGELTAEMTGDFSALSGAFDLSLSASGVDLSIAESRFDSLAAGRTTLLLSAKRDFDGLILRQAELHGDLLDLSASGRLADTNSDLNFTIDLADAAPLLEGLNGPVSIEGRGVQSQADWDFELTATAPADSTASLRATLPADGGGTADINLTIGRVETFVPALPGAADISASAQQVGDTWQITLAATGPFDSSVAGGGMLDPTGDANALTLTGTVPLAAANRQLHPNSVQGLANYDLALNGPLSLAALSGTVSLSGARFSIPDLRVALTDIGGTVTLRDSAAQISMTTNYSGGGQIVVDGSLGLTLPFIANLPVRLVDLRHQEGKLLQTVVNGTVTLSGPLTGGGRIAGDLTLGQTSISIASSALAGGGSLPDISHVNEPGVVYATRDRAGLIAARRSANSSARPFDLDLSIKVAERIEVRGLGVNADFSGGLDVTGTTANIATHGGLELIRGRMEFLTKTFELEEGRIALEGDLIPSMRVQATSVQPDATIRLILDGRLDNPQIVLESDPELPEDEVLSQLLFGRDLSSISALQAAQLAAALASMSGNGPAGVGRLGRNTGLDDLSLTFDESGTPGLRAGKYINENVYTEIGVDSEGKSSISLNLDVSESIRLKGKVGSDDESGIGIFFQRDY